MVADLDMDTSGAEGWGEDAELHLDEGIYYIKTIYEGGNQTKRWNHSFSLIIQMDLWMLKRDWEMRELLGKRKAEAGMLRKIWTSHQNW